KIVNNMQLAISLQGVVEGAVLAQRFGLDPKGFFDIAAVSSGDSWRLRNWYPVPGGVETSPSDRQFAAGFSTMLMHKDVGLALAGAQTQDVELPAASLVYEKLQQLIGEGWGDHDTSILIRNVDSGSKGLPEAP